MTVETRFVRNVWYIAGWASEFEGAGPFGRKIINEPVVIYRDSRGKLIAMVDRCPHRWAPLSMGRVEGDDLRCMYHGVKFSAAGRCIEIPDQPKLPVGDTLSIRTFPIVEKHRFVWVWLGNPAGTREDLIPDLSPLTDPKFAVQSGSLDYEANYALVNDNLLDLSHVAYNHEKTLGRLPSSISGSNAKRIERGVRTEGWSSQEEFGDGLRGMYEGKSGPDAPGQGGANAQPPADTFGRIDYFVPGIYHSFGAFYPPGTAKACKGLPPDHGPEPLGITHSIQAVTPMTTRTSRYFFSELMPVGMQSEVEAAAMWKVVVAAFQEDLVTINAQQKMIEEFPGRRMGGIAADRGFVLFRQLMNKMMEEEGTEVNAQGMPA